MKLTARERVSRLTASYWFIPLMVALAGASAALILLQMDIAASRRAPLAGLWTLFPTSAEGARALLSAIIGSMVTAISVTFSVTIVALTVAAQHFGPRVLNNFVRHAAAQVVLGLFIATFIYAVIVLGAVRGDEGLPGLAIIGAVALVLMSIGGLIYYVHHVSTSLQVGQLTSELARDFKSALDGRGAAGAEEAIRSVPDDDHAVVCADATGYLQRIDYRSLADEAGRRDARIWLRREPGAFVVAGAPIALIAPSRACDEHLGSAVRLSCVFGKDRTLWHDPEFAVKQLVEIALRALSPGVNEPFTAITCIDRLTEGLAAGLGKAEPPAVWRDDQGTARVFAEPQTWTTLLRASFDPIRLFAGGNPAIYARLADAIGELALLSRREADRAVLREQLDLARAAAGERLASEYDRRYALRRLDHALAQMLAGPRVTRK